MEISFADFEAKSRAAGYDEVLERRWTPDTFVPIHSHPFAVHALVAEGEFWLTCDGSTRHFKTGETFQLEAEVPHHERYGPEGAVLWAARHHPR